MDDTAFLMLCVLVGVAWTVLRLYQMHDQGKNFRSWRRLEDQGYHSDVDGTDERKIEQIHDSNGPRFD